MSMFLALFGILVVLGFYSWLEIRINQQACPECGKRISADDPNRTCPRCGTILEGASEGLGGSKG